MNTVGRQCTRGDEVIGALEELLKKMETLEGNRRAAHEFATDDLREHVDLVECQCALLQEQLRYARKMLALSTTLRSSPEACFETDIKEPCFVGVDGSVRSRHRTASLSQVSRSSKTNGTSGRTRQRSTSETDTRSDRTCSTDQYRISLADIPFILSKSTSQSHSLPANLQNLVSLLKKSQPAQMQRKRSNSKCSDRAPSTAFRRSDLRRTYSDHDLRCRDDGPERELLDLMMQGEQLLTQVASERMTGSRHSLKCQCRRLVRRIESKLAEFEGRQAESDEVKNIPTKPSRSQYKPIRPTSNFNRMFLRELKRIQSSLKEHA